MSEPTRYPLAWPAHRPRKAHDDRLSGRFTSDRRPITLSQATRRVLDEIVRLGGVYGLISTNIAIRKDGLPLSGQRAPEDPGVCVYFQLKGQPYALACDTYHSVEHNLAAVAAHIDATRAITRHGVASAAETLQAFSALPPPADTAKAATAPPARDWRTVLRLMSSWPSADLEKVDQRAIIQARYRNLAAQAHPDTAGGSDAAMGELNSARDAALDWIAAQ